MKEWRHGGNVWQVCADLGCNVEDIIDFSSSVNPLGPPQWVWSVIDSTRSLIKHYPDPFCAPLRSRIADLYGIETSQVLPGNGTSELLYLLPQALRPSRAVIPVPSYVDYEYAAKAAKVPVSHVVMESSANFNLPIEDIQSILMPGDMVYLGRPNNPTGVLYGAHEIRYLAAKNEDVFFVIDEAFYDFVQDGDPLINDRPHNVALLFSLTKVLAVPGVRVGWLVADHNIVEKVARVQPPWSVNVFAQAIGQEALKNRHMARELRDLIAEGRTEMTARINELSGFHAYPSEANYLLVKIENPRITAAYLKKKLLEGHRILIRTCDNFVSLDERFFRICIRTSEDNARLAKALKQIVARWETNGA